MASFNYPPNAVILDTNVLSRFAQISRIDLLPHIFTMPCVITPTIYRELQVGEQHGIAYLQPVIKLVQNGVLIIMPLEPIDHSFINQLPAKLGQGEAEAIALSERLKWIFISHDRKAMNYGDQIGLNCLRLEALVKQLQQIGLLSDIESNQILAP